MSFDFPKNDPVTVGGVAFRTWMEWFSRVHTIVSSAQQSGPTAERPTVVLWIGRVFYDTTLNKPVYVAAVKPTVWRDASGNPV